MKTSEKILSYIERKGQASGKELADFLELTDRAVRKQLKNLLETKKIVKHGKPPVVFYTKKVEGDQVVLEPTFALDSKKRKILEDHFLYVTPRGERYGGFQGITTWATRRNQDPEKMISQYLQLYEKYASYKKGGVISGKDKFQDTFKDNLCLDDIFYADFYAWEVFGKTKLGQLLLYAKQSQDVKMIKEVVQEIKPILQRVIAEYNIDAVAYVPPTVKREKQFMDIFLRNMHIRLHHIALQKVKTPVITPQKTLSKLQDRIENATETFFFKEERKFKRVLLIDDAVGSGATLNQIACKLKSAKVAKAVFGFGITGSVKGFDVISEV